MRDPKRIPEVTKALEEVWLLLPDLRLWQLVELLNTKYNKMYGGPIPKDPFFIEDDKWLKVIQSLKEEMTYIHPTSPTHDM